MEVTGQLHAPVLFTPGKEPPVYELDRRLGVPQSRSRHGGEAKNSQVLPKIEHKNIRNKVINFFGSSLGYIPWDNNICIDLTKFESLRV
jgi:hypothetical protein